MRRRWRLAYLPFVARSLVGKSSYGNSHTPRVRFRDDLPVGQIRHGTICRMGRFENRTLRQKGFLGHKISLTTHSKRKCCEHPRDRA